MQSSPIIRPFEKKDKQSIRDICADTGLWGKPIDPVFQDRNLFAKLIVDPYLKLEPEHALVVEDKGKVVGYMISSMKKDFGIKSKIQIAGLGAIMGLKFISGKYSNHAPSKNFVKWSFTQAMSQELNHPKNAAHLHLNMLEDYRNINLGKKLLNEFEQMAKASNHTRYYGEVFSSNNRRFESLYNRLGFEIVDKKRCTIFGDAIKDDIYAMCITKKLK